jgi:hypothetical protein
MEVTDRGHDRMPAIASTPGIVINRATTGSDKASTANSLSTTASSAP